MTRKNFTIRLEASEDHAVIEALHYEAFGHDDTVGKLVRDLRGVDAIFPTISLLAESEFGQPRGHVMLSHAWLDSDARLVDVMVLSPLAVHPQAQKQGLGTALIGAAIKAAEALGAPMLFLEGNHNYYGQRGFEAATPLGIRRPSLRIPEKAFQIAKLSNYSESMTGTFVYKDVHWRHGIGLYRAS